jgi:hypothetical protein
VRSRSRARFPGYSGLSKPVTARVRKTVANTHVGGKGATLYPERPVAMRTQTPGSRRRAGGGTAPHRRAARADRPVQPGRRSGLDRPPGCLARVPNVSIWSPAWKSAMLPRRGRCCWAMAAGSGTRSTAGRPESPSSISTGIPGSRLEARFAHPAAAAAGLRVIALDRPGYGLPDFQPGRAITDWPGDVAEAAGLLQLPRFSAAGASGGRGRPGIWCCSAGPGDSPCARSNPRFTCGMERPTSSSPRRWAGTRQHRYLTATPGCSPAKAICWSSATCPISWRRSGKQHRHDNRRAADPERTRYPGSSRGAHDRQDRRS